MIAKERALEEEKIDQNSCILASLPHPAQSDYFFTLIGSNKPMKLLFRATLHGWTAMSYHKRCDGYANTVALFYSDSKKAFGGFRSSKITPNKTAPWKPDKTAFLFSLSY